MADFVIVFSTKVLKSVKCYTFLSFFLFFIIEYEKKYVILQPILEVMRLWKINGRVRYRPQMNDSLRRAM